MWRFWWVLALAVAFCFWGARPLWESSEGRYAQAAASLLAYGDPLVPRLGGMPHITKPVFSYWMIAAGVELLGANAWGARLFLSVAFFGTILCVKATAQVCGATSRAAIVAAMVFATSPLPFAAGHVLTADGFLLFWISLGVLSYWRARAREGTHWKMVFWVAFGMAFFTKGPPGWLPLIAVGWDTLRGRGDKARGSLFSPVGILMFLVLSLWWYLAVETRLPGSLNYFLGNEVRDRILTDRHGRDTPFYSYFGHLLWGLGPWCLPALLLLRRLRSVPRPKPGSPSSFMLVWFCSSLLVFCVAKSRMPLYIAPLFVPMALWIGPCLVDQSSPLRSLRPANRLLLGFVGACFVVAMPVMTLWQDGWPRARSLAGFGAEVGRFVGQQDSETALYWAFMRPKYSVDFYSGREILGTGRVRSQELPALQRPLVEQGVRVLFVIPTRESRRFAEWDCPILVHAEAQGLSLIELENPRQEAPHGWSPASESRSPEDRGQRR